MFALIDEVAQNGFHRRKGFDFTFYVGYLRFGAGADIPTLLLRLNAQRQKFPNFIERETKLFSPLYKSQPLCCFRRELPIPGLSSRRFL